MARPHSPAQRASRRAAEQEAEESGGNEVGGEQKGQGVYPPGAADGGQLLPGLGERRGILAEMAAQVVIPLQQVHIGAVGGHPPHLGPHLPRGSGKGDDDTVGDHKGVGLLNAVSVEEPQDGFLYPVDLRAAFQKAVAQVGGQIEQCVMIHKAPPFLIHQFTPFFSWRQGGRSGKNGKIREKEKTILPWRPTRSKERKIPRRLENGGGKAAGQRRKVHGFWI